MSIDLHIHTSASDGNQHPKKVLALAAEKGLRTIAFADHETTKGYEIVREFAEGQGVKIIPAVEVQAFYRNKEIHILGYCVNPEKDVFQSQLAELRKERNKCAYDMVEKINSYGFIIEWEEVKKLASLGGPISKGHIMQVLTRNGYINSREDAIRIMGLYLNHNGKAYCGYDFSVSDAIKMIEFSGGIPVLAHPGLIGDDTIVEEIIQLGIRGLEVFYYYFGPDGDKLIRKYEELAQDKKLIMTGGSDYHGTLTPVSLGQLQVPQKVLSALLSGGSR